MPLPAETGSRDLQGSPGLQQLQARAFRVLTESPLVSWSLWSASSSCGTQARPLLAHIHRLHQEGKFTEVSVSSLCWRPPSRVGG